MAGAPCAMAARGYAAVWLHFAGRVSPVVANQSRSTLPPSAPTDPTGTGPGSGVPGSAPVEPSETTPHGSTASSVAVISQVRGPAEQATERSATGPAIHARRSIGSGIHRYSSTRTGRITIG